MALLPIHQYYNLNGTLSPVSGFIASENAGGIYEVIRIEQGIPLFEEEHLARFYQSAKIAGRKIPFRAEELHTIIAELVAKNKAETGNILISCKTNLKAYFIPHKYPTVKDYTEGVSCGVLHAERNTPKAKVFQTGIREKSNQIISATGVYEVILVNHENKITEGSRSNLFFIKENVILTSPVETVLPGITRAKALDCAREINAVVREVDIIFDELASFDAVFISGTSPRILPVKQIESLTFNVNHKILNSLMLQYDKKAAAYIAERK